MGALPPGDAGDLPRRRRSAPRRSCRASGRGDQPQQFVGLQRAVVAGLTAGDERLPDLGLRRRRLLRAARRRRRELFVRWAQLGAVSPIMEVGGVGPERDAWVLGPDGDDGAPRRGRPPLRALPVPLRAAPGPPARAAPARLRTTRSDPRVVGRRTTSCSSGPTCSRRPSAGPATTPTVYLPPGSWVDLYTGPTVGRRPRRSPARRRLSQFPFYARAGAVVPVQPAHADRLLVGRRRAHPPGPRRLPRHERRRRSTSRGQPHDVQLFVPAARRPGASRSAARPCPGPGTPGRSPAPSSACTGPASRAQSPSRRHRMSR